MKTTAAVLIRYFALCMVLLCFPVTLRAALTQLTAGTGEVRDLLQTDSTTIYAATQGGGIFKSTDNGTSWFRLTGFAGRYVWRLAGHSGYPSLLYAATVSGLLKSIDGGSTWTHLTFDNVRAIAVDPFDQNHVLLGVPGAGIYSSWDGGNTFALTSSGLDSADVTSIAFDSQTPNVVYVGLNSNASGNWGGIFKSTNGGVAWVDWNNPGGKGALGNKFVTGLVVDDQHAVHAGTWNPNTDLGGIYKQSGSNGWIIQKELYGVETLVRDKYSSQSLWAGSRSYGPYKTSNNGSSWAAASKYPHDFMYTGTYALLIPDATGRALAGVKGLGVYRSASSTGTTGWNFSGNGLSADRARDYVADSSTNTYMALAGGGVMRSQNSGPWSPINNGLWYCSAADNCLPLPNNMDSLIENNLTITNLGVSGYDPTTLYAAAWGRGLFKWDPATLIWKRVSESGLPNDPRNFLKPTGLLIHPSDKRMLYYSLFDVGQGVYMRDTAGTWSLVQPGPFSGQGASRIVISPDNARLYAFMYDDLPYRSTNSGVSWTQVSASDTGFMRLAFHALAENPLRRGYVLAATNKGLFASFDYGSTWSGKTVSGPLGSTVLTGLVFSPSVNGRVWAVDRSGGFYCSNDDGSTWNLISTMSSAIWDIRLINGALYLISDGSGVYKETSLVCP